ncbi:MAG TPA: ATP-binding protein [Rhizobacter sp.]|nr:ATP-binding protein [Rhizobacter sp.]
MNDLSIRARLTLLIALLLVLMGVAAGFALYQLRNVTLSVKTVYADRVLPLLQLRAVANAYLLTMPSVVREVRDGHQDAAAGVAELEFTRKDAREQWARYKATYLVPQEKALIAEAEPLIARAEVLNDKAADLLRRGDVPGMRSFVANDLYPVLQPLDVVLERLNEVQAVEADTEARASQGAYAAGLWGLIALVALALTLGVGLAVAVGGRYARERREGEARAVHQAHCYAALSRTNQMIVRVSDAKTMFEEICRICVETKLARVAFALRLDGEAITVAGSAGPAADVLAVAPTKLETTGPLAKGTAMETLREGRRTIANDYLNDERTALWHDRARVLNIRAVGAFPVRRGGAVVGSLHLFVDQVGFFDEARIALLDEMVGDLSFALDNIDREAARVRAEQQVEAGYARLRRVFNLMPVSILMISRRSGRVIETNATSSQRYGRLPEEMIGRTMADLGIGLEGDERERFYATLDSQQVVREFEARLRSARGELLDLLISAELIDYQGEPCVLTVSLDITERKRREQAERERLDAQASSHAKTDFLSRMSHELRTPLNAVLGFSQLMQTDAHEPLSERQRARVESIRQAGWHLLALINDVLDVSRIESGHLQVESRGVDLCLLLDEVLDLVRAQADTAGVRLEAAYRQAPAAVVQGDPLRLRQVMLNVLSNAVKYNRAGGSVHVSLRVADKRAVVAVTDTGIGMTRAQLDKLYEPFNRLGRESSSIEGTGIGLVLTRQLVHLMQGSLEVESEAGRGTTVRVTLPQGEPLSQRGELDARAFTQPGELGQDAPQGVVLYIEDNPINLLLVEQLLLPWKGVRLVQAETGEKGLELARALHPDLVLLDMRLPDMDGPEVMKALRVDPQTRDLRVVALSASAMPDEVALARESGAFDYWTKPLDFERFMADLRRLLPVKPA